MIEILCAKPIESIYIKYLSLSIIIVSGRVYA